MIQQYSNMQAVEIQKVDLKLTDTNKWCNYDGNYPGKVIVTMSDFLYGNGVVSHGKKYPLLISTSPMFTPASLPVSYRSSPIALLQFLKERKQFILLPSTAR